MRAAERMPCVYIVSSGRNGTIYTGVTSNLLNRIWEHKQNLRPGFTARYGADRLVWFESYELMEVAIKREKQIKEWERRWKVDLIEMTNPEWRDLYEGLLSEYR